MKNLLVSILIGSVGVGVIASAEEYSPYVGGSAVPQVFWGDTHVHSTLSTDALGFGVNLGPDEAYRFAAGEEVTTSWGLKAKLGRPLDFIVLADHAESYGLMELVRNGDERLMSNSEAKEWHRQLNSTPEEAAKLRQSFYNNKARRGAMRVLNSLSDPALNLAVWNEALAVAEQHNKPGVFTTMLGYEWTSAPDGSNLHRVVVFRDDQDKVGKLPPLSATENPDPVSLWKYMQQYETEFGGQVLAIPHNGNLSNGLMFPQTERLGGKPADDEYFALRARWEPLYEVTQIKGDGEAYPLLSPDDDFADYETWDFGNFAGVPKTPDMFAKEYPRSAYGFGMGLAQSGGVNPYQFGLIGSSDSHTGLATVEENNFFGKHSGVEPGEKRWNKIVGKAVGRSVKAWELASSGYAAVWATANTREALWDAMKRKEVYATTGTRMTVRFFGGWNYSNDDVLAGDYARRGYAKGVPMGAVLAVKEGGAPNFMVVAVKDAIGANLDRVQIIKGWADKSGKAQEQIFNVVWAGDRQLDKNGKLTAIENTVDVKDASWSNSVGAEQLAVVWSDPDFDSTTPAFYYVRVLEIPTPRWTAYDQKRYGSEMPKEVPMTTQERAYTSPIWYQVTQ
jgi:hypothetical protein